MTVSPDDTQPRSPFKTPPSGTHVTIYPDDERPARGGSGCLTWGLVGLVVVGFALVITGLAGVAGWTSGTRTAQMNATATQNFHIDEQLRFIPADIDTGNTVRLAARIQYLATLTPGISGLDTIMATATSVYLTAQPTATFTPTATSEIVSSPEATLEIESVPTQGAGGFDLAALLSEAQQDISLRDWDAAIETLDIILASDDTYEANTVRTLMSQALVEKANSLLLSPNLGDLAEGVILTDRAREYGNVDKINYESYIASLYLEGISALGINYLLAIQKLSAVYSQVPTYRDVGQQLFNQYVSYGDAWVAQSEYCPAAAQYQTALTIFNDAGANGKLSAARDACAVATPIGAPAADTLPTGTTPIAPVGVGG